jgi:hypothetical protein
MKGSGITGPVAKECAELWPRIAANAGSICWRDDNNMSHKILLSQPHWVLYPNASNWRKELSV